MSNESQNLMVFSKQTNVKQKAHESKLCLSSITIFDLPKAESKKIQSPFNLVNGQSLRACRKRRSPKASEFFGPLRG